MLACNYTSSSEEGYAWDRACWRQQVVIAVCKGFSHITISCFLRNGFIYFPSCLALKDSTNICCNSHIVRIMIKQKARRFLPVVVFKVVDTLAFDRLLQDLRLTATKLLTHLHQPEREGWREKLITNPKVWWEGRKIK